MEWISTKDRLPDDGVYVLAKHNRVDANTKVTTRKEGTMTDETRINEVGVQKLSLKPNDVLVVTITEKVSPATWWYISKTLTATFDGVCRFILVSDNKAKLSVISPGEEQ